MARRRPPPAPESSLSLRALLEAAKANGEPLEALQARLGAAVEVEAAASLASGSWARVLREARRALVVRV